MHPSTCAHPLPYKCSRYNHVHPRTCMVPSSARRCLVRSIHTASALLLASCSCLSCTSTCEEGGGGKGWGPQAEPLRRILWGRGWLIQEYCSFSAPQLPSALMDRPSHLPSSPHAAPYPPPHLWHPSHPNPTPPTSLSLSLSCRSAFASSFFRFMACFSSRLSISLMTCALACTCVGCACVCLFVCSCVHVCIRGTHGCLQCGCGDARVHDRPSPNEASANHALDGRPRIG